MAQLSRPYQVGLAAVVLLAAVWLLLIQGHHTSSSGSGSSAPVATTPAPAAKATPTPSQSTAKAPGQSGLEHAIAKANGAVATSQTNAKQLEKKSEAASSASGQSSSAAASTPSSSATSTSASKAKPAAPDHAKVAPAPGVVKHATSSNSRERAVETALAHGKVAVILFWDPRGSVDVAVHRAVAQLRGDGALKIAVEEARANEVASFGTITRGIQVYGTPTLLIVNKSGQTRTLTGLQDAYAIKQAIRETRHS
jgi:hypothetical protein